MCMGGGGGGKGLAMQQMMMQQQMQQMQAQQQMQQQAAMAQFNADLAKSKEEDKQTVPLAPIRPADDEAIAAREKMLTDAKRRNGYAGTVLTNGAYGGSNDRFNAAGATVLLGGNAKPAPATQRV